MKRQMVYQWRKPTESQRFAAIGNLAGYLRYPGVEKPESTRWRIVTSNGVRYDDTRLESTFLKHNLHDATTASTHRSNVECLYQQLTKIIEAKPRLLAGNLGDENTDPAAQPLFWISKWVDYSDQYDFGYQLCDIGHRCYVQ
uniref:Uncharacterized protein n=1 Tax=Glossina palpalis gambiensis TaxID=67801 RepID=A0A1B0BJF7_9MUSC